MHCPNTKLSYFEPESQMLRCPKSGMVYSNYEHFMIGAPRELFRQLSMGYYDEKRSHGLDAFILGSGVSAVRSGETVAEVGCGVGCYTDSLAKGAGPDGKVVAMDVDESVLKFVEYNADSVEYRPKSRKKCNFVRKRIQSCITVSISACAY